MSFYQWRAGRLILSLRVIPRARRDELGKVQGDVLSVRIQAPPVDGKANARLCAFLAKEFGVAKSAVELLAGETGRTKRVAVSDPSRLPSALNIEPVE